MKGFHSGDKYHEERENTSSSGGSNPLRSIPPYDGLTDQPTSSAQRHSNDGEKLSESLYNLIFGHADTLSPGSSEYEDKYIGYNPEPSYDTHHHQGRTDYDMPCSSHHDSAGEKLADRATSSAQKSYRDKSTDQSEQGSYGNGGRDRSQEHICDTNQTEGEIAKTKKYLKRLKNKKSDIYKFACDVLQNTNTNQNGLLEALSQINEKLEESLFKQEKETAKEHIRWVKTFTKRFNIREDWVQAGIEQQLGMKLEDFYNSYQQLQKLTKDSSPESYEKLVVANAKCEFIRELLKHGIPVERIPDRICGRKVTNVNGKGYNCLIRALLKGAHPGWEDELIEAGVKDMRRLLEEDNLVKAGAMLDLGSEEGALLINSVKTANWTEPDREVLVYQYCEGKIQCFSITDGTSDKPPYAVLREHEGEHFCAIEVPE
jgi:hypothetical protein